MAFSLRVFWLQFCSQSSVLSMCNMPPAPTPKNLYYIVTWFWTMRSNSGRCQTLRLEHHPMSAVLTSYVPPLQLSVWRCAMPCWHEPNQQPLLICGSLLCINEISFLHVIGFVVLKTNNTLIEQFLCYLDYTMAQFVTALRYKPEGRGFDSRWAHCYF